MSEYIQHSKLIEAEGDGEEGDLYERLARKAQSYGVRVLYWNPADPMRSQSWNWLDEVRDHRDVEAVVLSILGRPRPKILSRSSMSAITASCVR